VAAKKTRRRIAVGADGVFLAGLARLNDERPARGETNARRKKRCAKVISSQ